MSRRKKNPLRPLSAEERTALTRLTRSQSAPAGEALRARALLAVAEGASYRAAAARVGRHGDTVTRWVNAFNHLGLDALRPGHGGGPKARYQASAQQRILAEFARVPDRE